VRRDFFLKLGDGVGDFFPSFPLPSSPNDKILLFRQQTKAVHVKKQKVVVEAAEVS
jgi:hypothetical protein